MEQRPAGWSVCLPLLIFFCTIKSRGSLLAPAHPGGPGKGAVKWLWCKHRRATAKLAACANFLTTSILPDFYISGGSWASCNNAPLLIQTKFGMRHYTHGYGLSTPTCQISSECVHCVSFRWPKTIILGNRQTKNSTFLAVPAAGEIWAPPKLARW